ncbi:extracellular solute-binding protein [Microlunatus sp. Gsoil 973]|nr:extracellular solute-binding protein [Microlunatus sp. Gsoil 973]
MGEQRRRSESDPAEGRRQIQRHLQDHDETRPDPVHPVDERQGAGGDQHTQQAQPVLQLGGGSIREYAEADLLVDLTPKLTSDTTWRDTFVKSVLDAGKIGDKYYDIPLKGMQPVLLFYNKTMFADVGVKPPETWDDIKSLVNTFKQKEITPFVLGGQDSWTELMYLEFLVDRLGGPEVFQRVENGDAAGWGDPVFLKSLEMIRELVDMGAFGTNYSSIGYGNGSASALFAKGKAAMHLMGTWEFTSQQGSNPKFVKNDLDYTNFPAVDGGKGGPEGHRRQPDQLLRGDQNRRVRRVCGLPPHADDQQGVHRRDDQGRRGTGDRRSRRPAGPAPEPRLRQGRVRDRPDRSILHPVMGPGAALEHRRRRCDESAEGVQQADPARRLGCRHEERQLIEMIMTRRPTKE